MTSTAAPTADPVRVRDTRDLLSVVPYLLGYRPADSLVVVCIREGGALGLVARTELADLRRPADRAEYARLVATRAGEDRTRCAWIIVYSDTAEPGGPERAAVDSFAAALGVTIPEHEAWVVGAERYRSLSCDDPLCCAPDGYPVDELDSTAPGAELVLAGRAPLASRDALYRVHRARQAHRDLCGRAATRWDRARRAASTHGDAERRAWRSRSFDAWTQALAAAGSGRTPTPALLGRLASALDDRWVRDGVLLCAVDDSTGLAAAMARADAGHEEIDAAVGEAMAGVVDPVAAVRPDEARTAACVAVLEAVVAHATRRRTAPPLTLLAFLAWWSGEGGRAGFRVAEALAVDPEYRLALLLAAVVDAALPPGWVRARGLEGLDRGNDGVLG